jgi:phosphoenolpyruvate synthase/pyruvate phosphate dikinase
MDHNLMFMAPVIHRMVNSHVSGILYTSNHKPGSKDEMRIEAKWVIGDAVISGKIMSDSFILNKPTMGLKDKNIVEKTVTVVFDEKKVLEA